MKKILFLFFLAGVLPALLWAQQGQGRVVTGIVKDANGPLSGATVMEKGRPANTVAADENGKFRIVLHDGTNTLVISYLNYQKQELPIKKNARDVEVVLQQSTAGMDEAIVVGFGKKKRITNTGAVSSINADEIRDIPTSSVQNALTGKMPGFITVQRSGQPGKDASDYFIRGVSSLNPDGNKPLIVVDDIEYTYDQLSQINVNEIESISILKDASTTAIYGIKGANGVLVVPPGGERQVSLISTYAEKWVDRLLCEHPNSWIPIIPPCLSMRPIPMTASLLCSPRTIWISSRAAPILMVIPMSTGIRRS